MPINISSQSAHYNSIPDFYVDTVFGEILGWFYYMYVDIYSNDVETAHFNTYKIAFNKDRPLYLFNIKNWLILGLHSTFARCIEQILKIFFDELLPWVDN